MTNSDDKSNIMSIEIICGCMIISIVQDLINPLTHYGQKILRIVEIPNCKISFVKLQVVK